ncbi:hypothetical protein [Rubinisphaera margarita]|uniref:hypothetical protein n=1 Tax=Rubinisphaera margarita TaxID=2909586 RepID=UPI001EE81105|nr:hypothetical protein [Rubinisphaera margarita]MCG6158418.1 hypothetical protein [Rubinisphaera margarita]
MHGCTVFVLSAMLLVLAGCGGSEDPQPAAPQAGDPAPQQDTAAETTPAAKTSDAPSQSGDNGRKYVDGIPYDVFFDRPLNVAAENTTPSQPIPAVTMNPASPDTSPGTMNPSQPATTPPVESPASGDGVAWNTVITEERLLEEVTRLRNTLTANLNSVGNFNRELLNIKIDGATLAALAGIATEHSGDFTWKDKAHFVRDLSSNIAIAAESRGRPAFEEAEMAFLNIVEILNGGSPAELPESDQETVFSDVADRNLLMQKIRSHNDWLRTTISNEKELQNEKDQAIARAALLRALGQVVHEEDYVFADEEEYQKYCRELIDGAGQMLQGAEGDDFEEFQAGFELLNKSCNDCHPVYLNN